MVANPPQAMPLVHPIKTYRTIHTYAERSALVRCHVRQRDCTLRAVVETRLNHWLDRNLRL